VRVSARLTAPEVHARSFFTVNHPTNFALERIVAAIHAQLRRLPWNNAAEMASG